MADTRTIIFDDPRSGTLGYAIVEVADRARLDGETVRRLADGAVTRTLGWVRLSAPSSDLTPHREPVEVFVGAPGREGLREVYIGDDESPAATFRLTPSRRGVTA